LHLSYCFYSIFSLLIRPSPCYTLFPYTTLFRSLHSLARRKAHRGLSRVSQAVGIYGARQSASATRRPMWPLLRPSFDSSFNARRSEEHTSELQSRFDLVCRLLLEKKQKNNTQAY